MTSEEPPFIRVGADVSAKFKGAFCEARVKAIKKFIKCKVLLKHGASCIVNDDQIDGPLKVNETVRVKQDNDLFEGTITKLTDNSLYTVIFDDGDEKTLRRTSLCLKGERHFQEDENLDNRPLNNPENFSTPVPRPQREEKTRKRTRLSSQNSDNDEEEDDPKTTPKKKRESVLGKVVCVELGERRKSWFPALCLQKHANELLLEKGQILVQSFKDGRKIGINRSDWKEFSKDKEPLLSYIRGDTKIDPILRSSIEKALAFYDNGELPRGWNIDLPELTETSSSDEGENETEECVSREEEVFLNKLYKIMDNQGTPISKPPLLGCKEIDLFKLYGIVVRHGGMDEVTNLSKWRSIYVEIGMPNPPTTASYNLRNFYKRYLYPYEALEKGIEINTEKKDKDEKDKEKTNKHESDSENENNVKRRLTRMQTKNESDSELERRETRSSRPRRGSIEKPSQDVKGGKQIASPVESSDESSGSYLDMGPDVAKKTDVEMDSDATKHSEAEELVDIVNSPHSSVLSEDKEFSDTRSESEMTMTEDGKYPIGARILVKYGKGKLHRAYEAKIIAIDSELGPEVFYFVHYSGWNNRYDEWIKHDFIEGLSPYPPKKKGGPAKTTKGKDSTSVYKSHPEPPGIHQYHASSPTPRTTARSRKAGSPSHSLSANASNTTPDKSSKSLQNSQKGSNSAVKHSSSVRGQVNVSKQVSLQKVSSKPATPKASFAVQKIDTSFSDMKANPVKARTTRNSMQDVFLINAIEESISEAPTGSDVIGTGRSRKLREKQTHSPGHEEDESESSSAKEDDVDSLERGRRSTPQRKATRRKRNEKSPYNRQEGKDSAEDEESTSDYTWSDRKDLASIRGDSRSKLVGETKRKKGAKGKAVKSKNLNEDENREHLERQTSAMEILTDCALQKEAEDLNPKQEEVEFDSSVGEVGLSKRKVEEKSLKRTVKNEVEKNLLKKFEDETIIERSESESASMIKAEKNNDSLDIKRIKTENNNLNETVLGSESEIACMEHVVNILQQAAAIDAEKHRKCEEIALSPSHKEGRKRKRERKRRRRHTSSCIPEASESENSTQSPFRKGKDRNHSTVEFDKEKFDFVSDLNELAELEAVERIRIMQSRIYEIQKLYGKLKTELASIERRRRRKLRRQGENTVRTVDLIEAKQ